MKQLKLLVFICIITFATSCGQQKKYVSYKVKEGETMRVIAKELGYENERFITFKSRCWKTTRCKYCNHYSK